MKTLVILMEEQSAKALLEGLLPRILPGNTRVIPLVFQGKQDLESNITRKLQAWQDDKASFLILRDQDNATCKAVKDGLVRRCQASGKRRWKVRVACRELEAWLLGDLAAVEAGLNLHGVAQMQGKKKFREPDNTQRPSDVLREVTGGAYQKVGGCRAIGPYLSLNKNASPSYRVFVDAVKELTR
ncbi:MAG: DUF4276 family protein [Deltaproteobacteria bacterium]|nr:DUF4276 family protein [Deltaproteobacteria bacterium]